MVPAGVLRRIASACAAQPDCWLVADNTYEDFTYEPPGAAREHVCVQGDRVINVRQSSGHFAMEFPSLWNVGTWRAGR